MKVAACTLFALLFAVAHASPVAEMRDGKTVRSFLQGRVDAFNNRVEALQKRQIARGWTLPPLASLGPLPTLPTLPANNPTVPKLVRFFGAQDLQSSLRKRLAEIEATQQRLIDYFKQLREHQFLQPPPCDDATTTTSTTTTTTAAMSTESTSTSTTDAPKEVVSTESAETIVPSTSEETVVSSSTTAAPIEDIAVPFKPKMEVRFAMRNNNIDEVAETTTEAEEVAFTDFISAVPRETTTEAVEDMTTEEVATTQTSA